MVQQCQECAFAINVIKLKNDTWHNYTQREKHRYTMEVSIHIHINEQINVDTSAKNT